MDTKTCRKCLVDKALTSFYRRSRNNDGYYHVCKLCFHANLPEHDASRKRKYYHQNRLKYRERRLIRLYGITLADYDRILEEQGGGCAICSVDMEQYQREFDVDHCHETGKVRGLLCNPCNQAIGLLDEHPERLARAAQYLGFTLD